MILPSGHITNDEEPAAQSQPQLTTLSLSFQIENGLTSKSSLSSSSPGVGNRRELRIGGSSPQPAEGKARTVLPTSPGNWEDIGRHLNVIQEKLKKGWTVHVGTEGRLYYCNHFTLTAGWLPACENWSHCEQLPYGWERAVDSKGRPYFINHLNKTSTYEAPDCIPWDENPPEPRLAVLQRSSTMGFGFVAGSERPVIVRFVTEDGPSVNKLQPGDQILAVNGEDVKEAPRDHVIQLVRACESQVTLLVCQPANNYGPGKKSTLLSAGKRAKLRTRPSRVRFAESVCVNGAPLFPTSAFSLGDICVPPMANVLKVFLENGQTKSFKYDTTTTVMDVVISLHDKLCFLAVEHFSLVLEHVKSLKRNKLTLLDPEETLARIAARPGAHKLRCLFRVTFVPISAAGLAQKDLNALDYLYMQCCNDVTQERFAPELQPEVALRLAALHMHQHSLANNVSPAKLTVKIVEREFGLERFVPSSLIEGMKRKELRRLIAHFLKLNSQMTGSSTKMLTQLQAKIHYLDIISSLPSYGAKCFSTNQREGVERVLLVSPRFGLSQIAGVRNSVPQPITAIEDLSRVIVNREDDVTCSVGVFMHADRVVKFSMEDRDACEFSLVLAGYYRLLTGKELLVDRERENYDEDNAPSYLAQHTVLPAAWSYLLPYHNRAHSINFLTPPYYQPVQQQQQQQHDQKQEQQQATMTTPSADSISSTMGGAIGGGSIVEPPHSNQCDRNMNLTNVANNNHKSILERDVSDRTLDLDMHSVMAMELLEEAKDSGLSDSSGGGSSSAAYCSERNCHSSSASGGLVETKNEGVLRRVAEMQKMVENSEQYLNEHGELIHECELAIQGNGGSFRGLVAWQNGTSIGNGNGTLEFDSDCDSLNSSKMSSNEDAPPPGILKHSDSLVLLAEAINQDLTGITKGLNLIGGNQHVQRQTPQDPKSCVTNTAMESICSSTFNPHSQSHQDTSTLTTTTTPRPQRKVNGLSQLLSDLQALGNDFSQSESDSESVQSPSISPTHRDTPPSFNGGKSRDRKQKNVYRTSFGLHSPDGTSMGPDAKDYNLKEYLKQLKEISKVESSNQDTDLAAKKLSEIYGFEIGEDTFIETDSDLIDLRAIPPPQTPDELDSLSILNAAPRGFGDTSTYRGIKEDGDLDRFLAKVIVAPPTQKATPAKELTPEEIMSFIIPPPPNLEKTEGSTEINEFEEQSPSAAYIPAKHRTGDDDNIYSNSKSISFDSRSSAKDSSGASSSTADSIKHHASALHVIEYATVERKGTFSCCSKSKREDKVTRADGTPNGSNQPKSNPSLELRPPPRRSKQSDSHSPPARPPKSVDLQSRYSPKKQISFVADYHQTNNSSPHSASDSRPPLLPPRCAGDNDRSVSPMVSVAPKKPPLPPMAARPILRSAQPQLPKQIQVSVNDGSLSLKVRSPQLQQTFNAYRDIDNAFNTTQAILKSPRSNGHHRSNSDCPPVCMKNPAPENRPQLSLLCSPQMSRKFQSYSPNGGGSGISEKQLIMKNGYVIDGEALLSKTDIAMAGLLVKLDQVAAQCTAAQAAGGGSEIDEEKFQKARNELTDQTLALVTSSKLLVVAMSDMTLSMLPEHLTSCLTAIRRITELTQDMTRHNSAPLQTRNIVLKVHDVASSFRELAGVQIGPLGAGQLALQAECLANVLATLLRSLRVFSP